MRHLGFWGVYLGAGWCICWCARALDTKQLARLVECLPRQHQVIVHSRLGPVGNNLLRLSQTLRDAYGPHRPLVGPLDSGGSSNILSPLCCLDLQ
jgi:hypothetical protein